MITGFLMSLASGIVSWLLSLWPSWSLPSWMTDTSSSIGSLLTQFASMGVWLNWALTVSVVGAVLAAYIFNLTVRGLRWILGLFPTMGGGS